VVGRVEGGSEAPPQEDGAVNTPADGQRGGKERTGGLEIRKGGWAIGAGVRKGS